MAHGYEKQQQIPIYEDITIVQGDQYQVLYLWMTVDDSTGETLPMDLEGFTAKMQIRQSPGAEVIAEFSTSNARILMPVEGKDQVAEWESSGIYTFADSTKKWNIWLMFPATDTKQLPPGIYKYDLKIEHPGSPAGRQTFRKGVCCVEAEVTQ